MGACSSKPRTSPSASLPVGALGISQGSGDGRMSTGSVEGEGPRGVEMTNQLVSGVDALCRAMPVSTEDHLDQYRSSVRGRGLGSGGGRGQVVLDSETRVQDHRGTWLRPDGGDQVHSFQEQLVTREGGVSPFSSVGGGVSQVSVGREVEGMPTEVVLEKGARELMPNPAEELGRGDIDISVHSDRNIQGGRGIERDDKGRGGERGKVEFGRDPHVRPGHGEGSYRGARRTFSGGNNNWSSMDEFDHDGGLEEDSLMMIPTRSTSLGQNGPVGDSGCGPSTAGTRCKTNSRPNLFGDGSVPQVGQSPQTADAFACIGNIRVRVRDTSTSTQGQAKTETVTVKTTYVPMSRPLPVCGRYDHVLGMLRSLLKCDVVEVKFTEEEMQWHVSVAEELGTLSISSQVLEKLAKKAKGEVMGGTKLCPLMMVKPQDDWVIIPDMQQDEMFKDHPCVCGDPQVRFFAGIWIKSSKDTVKGVRGRQKGTVSASAGAIEDSHTYGLLYMADKTPRNPAYAQDIQGVLAEAARVLAMSIDQYKLEVIKDLLVMDRKRRQSVDSHLSPDDKLAVSTVRPALSPTEGNLSWLPGDFSEEIEDGISKMVSAVDCFQDGCMLVECIVGTKFAIGWNILHVNEALSTQLVCDADAMVGCGFWEFFLTDISDRSYANKLVRENRPFELTVTFQNTIHPKPAVYVLEFRPTARQKTSESTSPRSMVSRSPPHSRHRTDLHRSLSSDLSPPQTNCGDDDPWRSTVAPIAVGKTQLADGGKSGEGVASALIAAQEGCTTFGNSFPPENHISSMLSSVSSGGDRSYQKCIELDPESGRCSGEVKRHYFAHLKMEKFGGIGIQRRMLRLSKEAPRVFKDIRLGPLIGRGAYGRVYRGNWNGNIVAVKVITSDQKLNERRVEQVETGASPDAKGLHEAVLSSALSHPNVLHTFQYSFRHVPLSAIPEAQNGRDAQHSQTTLNESARKNGNAPKTRNRSRVVQRTDSSSSDKDEPVISELWLVSEFCNRGPLLTAIEDGLFMIHASNAQADSDDQSPAGSQTNLIYILQTAQEISAAMEYLHGHDVVHGDLTGGNVLLQSSDKDGRGFTAKVVDFGLSRVCAGGSLKTSKMGCAEYMPPELITRGLLTKAGDVYAFGVILWELYMGKRAWAGVEPADVLTMVSQGKILEFPPQTPRRLKILGERCLSLNVEARPTFSDVVHEVNAILADTMSILRKFLGISGF